MSSKLIDYQNPDSFASKMRRGRMEILMRYIESLAINSGTFRILDVGGTHLYWKHVPNEFFEKYNIQIVLLNLDAPTLPPEAIRFSSISGDACDLSNLGDNEFDLVHSNSVIEHVGGWENMKAMAKEMDRVGRAVFIQTPYFWFPVEPHFVTPFLHWLPLSFRCKLAMRMSLGNWPKAKSVDEAIQAQQSAVLLDMGMMRELFPKAKFQFERFFGFPKSIIASKL